MEEKEMAITIKVKQDFYSVPSGGKVKLVAEVEGVTKSEEKKLIWKAEKGKVDKFGQYTAPKAIEADIVDIVTVQSQKNQSISKTITVNVEAEVNYKEFVRIGEVKPIGSNGMYYLNIQCLNLYKFGNKCSIIVTEYDMDLESILPNSKKGSEKSPPIAKWAKHMIRVKTSSKGFVSIPLKPFSEKARWLHIRVKGTEIDKKVKLAGPKKKIRLEKKAGFWANFKQEFGGNTK